VTVLGTHTPLLYHQLSQELQGWEWHEMGILPSPSTAE